ncbi:K(+) efflux antiporter 6 [Selaginella moellendorffii]|uniref:K(+) efflux antiporter 6 n=1 Tax=Selaginella moellendorffii TaxID=88036 RepID=UPI000D1CB6FF|nr:K(+) efflux antiporter 6 [Selaginella moellendorffii]|eukprot:XP_024533320.1 K(+) efflux antiporter 6 [Selaginella moellendorffii]
MRKNRKAMLLALWILWISLAGVCAAAAASDAQPEITAAAAPPAGKEGTLAEMFDRVLDKEFSDKEDPQEGKVGSSFNSSVADQQAVLETVARVTHDKQKKNETQDQKNGTSKPFQIHDVFNLDPDNGAEELPTLIDKKDNVFVMSNSRSGHMVLQQDLRLISDLVVVIVSAAVGGILFACMGQPVITGYLLAGSIIGPGGLCIVSELVQVQTVAEFGVVFLLFALGLEFSSSKLRVVKGVAVFGGLIQILLFMCLCGFAAMIFGANISEGVFVGAFLSMSSTAVVLKFLMERNSVSLLYGQITVGTLILQDCAVGILFALLPVLGGESGMIQGALSIIRGLIVLSAFILLTAFTARSLLPRGMKSLMRLSTMTNELYQLAAVAFCLFVAWTSDKLGLSFELGAFTAGVMVSTTDFSEHTLHQVEPIRNLFTALFLASIGMLINVSFLWTHIDILVASLVLVLVSKLFVISVVVKAFGYNTRTALMVGISLAQVGEFAFVLLSRAWNLHLLQKKLYLLLLGTTALSLVTTPLFFRIVPVILKIGTIMKWFPESTQVEIPAENEEFPL